MNKIKKLYTKICSFKGINKYTIITAIFLIIIVFFDNNSLINRFKVYKEKKRTEAEIEKYRKEIKDNTDFIEAISSNTDALEKFAREEYLMKKKNEDIFIIEEE